VLLFYYNSVNVDYICWKDIDMATDKKRVFCYVGRDVDSDLRVLYMVWSSLQRKRGLVPNYSKFIEMILRRYVKGNRGIVDEFVKMKEKVLGGDK